MLYSFLISLVSVKSFLDILFSNLAYLIIFSFVYKVAHIFINFSSIYQIIVSTQHIVVSLIINSFFYSSCLILTLFKLKIIHYVFITILSLAIGSLWSKLLYHLFWVWDIIELLALSIFCFSVASFHFFKYCLNLILCLLTLLLKFFLYSIIFLSNISRK